MMCIPDVVVASLWTQVTLQSLGCATMYLHKPHQQHITSQAPSATNTSPQHPAGPLTSSTLPLCPQLHLHANILVATNPAACQWICCWPGLVWWHRTYLIYNMTVAPPCKPGWHQLPEQQALMLPLPDGFNCPVNLTQSYMFFKTEDPGHGRLLQQHTEDANGACATWHLSWRLALLMPGNVLHSLFSCTILNIFLNAGPCAVVGQKAPHNQPEPMPHCKPTTTLYASVVPQYFACHVAAALRSPYCSY